MDNAATQHDLPKEVLAAHSKLVQTAPPPKPPPPPQKEVADKFLQTEDFSPIMKEISCQYDQKDPKDKIIKDKDLEIENLKKEIERLENEIAELGVDLQLCREEQQDLEEKYYLKKTIAKNCFQNKIFKIKNKKIKKIRLHAEQQMQAIMAEASAERTPSKKTK